MSCTATYTKTKLMADGLNEARALRVLELMKDYRNIQDRIAQLNASPPPDERNEVGYTILHRCHVESRALLNKPYAPEMLHPPTGANEAAKRQLRSAITDASARRLQAQKVHMRASAAIKWINRRNAILQGRKPANGNLVQLASADTTLRNEIAAITDQRVFNGFRAADTQAGFWLVDDPSLPTLQAWIRAQ